MSYSNSTRYTILLLCMAVLGCLPVKARSPWRTVGPLAVPVAPSDTTKYGEDDLDEEEGAAAKERPKPKDRAKERGNVVDALDFVGEGRYKATHETFAMDTTRFFLPKWMYNMYVQGGLGVEVMNPPTNDYRILPMTQLQLGVGKDFSELHAARVLFHGGWGYQRDKELTLSKFGMKVDYLYNLSGYLAGYNPTRMLNLSMILGVGAQYSKMEQESGMSLEAHFGAQLRFFTGPKTYLTIEPYVGIGGDKMDLSGNRNWRKADLFYGANLNLIYYINNNLSPQSRSRLLAARSRHNRLTLDPDSLLENWQQPWFAQFSGGAAFTNSPNMDMMKTLGSELTFTIGKWLSPVVGLRGSLFSRTNVWKTAEQDAIQENYMPAYSLDLHNWTVGGRLEAMLNPLGFLRSFYWDQPFGFYLVGGAEYGYIQKMQSQQLKCTMMGWGGGVNLWYQMSPGLKVFLEPRFMHNEYKIPYTNIDWYKRYSDNYLTFNVGLAVEMRDDDRYYSHVYEDEYVTDRLRQFKIGLGGGTHLLQTRRAYSGENGLGWNGMLFGEYHFDRLKSVRLGVEFVNLKRSNLTQFTDYNMEQGDADYAPVKREGLWDHRYSFLLISPAGMVDLNYLSMRYHPQRFRLYAFGGPTMIWVLQYKRELSALERLKMYHEVDPIDAESVGFAVGAHVGLKFEARITRRWSAWLVPTVYMLGGAKMPGIEFTKLKTLATFNLGAQFSL